MITWLSFEGDCHRLFALSGCALFPEKLGWQLTNTWAFAFGRRHVLGDTSARVERIIKSLSDKIVHRHKGKLTAPKGP